MKRIYAFTLDSEDYPSSKFRSNLSLIAYLLYDIIYNYDGEYSTPLVINNTIKYNRIHESYRSNEYYLEYDKYDEKYINYEPFLIGNRSFALTIYDDLMSEEIICELMEQVMLLAKVDYLYTIKTMDYISKNKEDESNRRKAVRQLRDTLEGFAAKKGNFARKMVRTQPWFKRRVGLF